MPAQEVLTASDSALVDHFTNVFHLIAETVQIIKGVIARMNAQFHPFILQAGDNLVDMFHG